MLPGWMGWSPQLAAMSTNPLLMGNQLMGVPGTGMPGATGMPPRQPMPAVDMPSLTGALSAARSAGSPEEQKEKERAVVVRALREIAEQRELERRNEDASGSRASKAGEDDVKQKKAEEEDVDKKPRCHLHRKPNPKCKKCQLVIASQSQVSSSERREEARESRGGESARTARSPPRGFKGKEKLSFQCSPMLREQIAKCSYYRSMQDILSIDNLMTEIAQYADTIDVYNPGSRTDPSCFFCQVVRLSSLPMVDEELHQIIDSRDYPVVRCVGFLYLRFVTAPADLFDVFEDYLLDAMELVYTQDGAEVNATIGEYVESLLVKEKYFDMPLPRIPVKIRQQLEERVAPMAQHRKRMAANRRAIRSDNVDGLRVEVSIDGSWEKAKAQELLTYVPWRPRVRVTLKSGGEAKVSLGKVVLRRSRSRGARSSSRSRSRSRGRNHEPDWSRTKGKSDAEMVEELRNRVKDNAVCGTGKTYSKRPPTFDASMSSTALPHPGADDKQDSNSSRRRRPNQDQEDEERARRRRQEEDERARKLHSVYQKYCASSASAQAQASATAARRNDDIDQPDVLRLG